MPNQILVIAPYWHAGTWVFDDPDRGLDKEPFVEGIPQMINDLVQEVPNAQGGFRLLFSTAPFPGYQRRIEWMREDMNGNWYRTDEPPMEGWLCPALFKFFDTAPREIFVKAERINQGR